MASLKGSQACVWAMIRQCVTATRGKTVQPRQPPSLFFKHVQMHPMPFSAPICLHSPASQNQASSKASPRPSFGTSQAKYLHRVSWECPQSPAKCHVCGSAVSSPKASHGSASSRCVLTQLEPETSTWLIYGVTPETNRITLTREHFLTSLVQTSGPHDSCLIMFCPNMGNMRYPRASVCVSGCVQPLKNMPDLLAYVTCLN